MSVEYLKCKGCGKIERDCYMSHTEKGSYCDSCYKKFYPRDVPFDSPENLKRDIVLAIVLNEQGKGSALRLCSLEGKNVHDIVLPNVLRTWNLNINNGELDPKFCNLEDFPILTPKSGKYVSSRAGAWVIGKHSDGRLRLVSLSGQVKDVDSSVAESFHAKYTLANASMKAGGLVGKFGKPFPEIEDKDLFYVDPDSGVLVWERQDKLPLSFYPKDAIDTANYNKTPSEFFAFLEGNLSGKVKRPSHSALLACGKTQDTVNKLVAFSENKLSSGALSQMNKLNEELKQACEAYYNRNNSPLSDYEYDSKFDELLALEADTGIILPDSVTQGVGSGVEGKLKKVEHAQRMLSLDKTKDTAVLSGLLRQIPSATSAVLSWKLDGLTVVAAYENGKLKQAVTRGNGKIGEDITHNAKFFKGLPLRIPYTDKLFIRGEAVISFANFERINSQLPEGVEPYKNPRNLASGTVRRQEVVRDGGVEFIAFNAIRPGTMSSYSADLDWLTKLGFTVVSHFMCDESSLSVAIERFKDLVSSYDKPTDGLVLMLNNKSAWEELGSTGHHPRYAMAFKWADEKQKTVLRGVEWSASRTGALTPVAIFDPVELEGTTVKRASVHNLSMLRSLKLGIGDEISIYKANMIIPQIAQNHTNSDTVLPPVTCPVCGAPTEIRKDGISEFVLCANPQCVAKNVGALAHFVKREAMNIDGISEKTIADLVASGFIRKPTDFYLLKNHPEIAELPGWGTASYNKLLYAIENSRSPSTAQFIYALGIRGVGRSASEALAGHFETIDDFLKEAETEYASVEGVGSQMASDLKKYVDEHINDITELLTFLQPKSTSKPVASGCLSGLTFCITGPVDYPGKRAALQAYISSLGGKNASAVTKNVQYLITNTPNSGTSKNKAAQALGCKIISEDGFMRLVQELS